MVVKKDKEEVSEGAGVSEVANVPVEVAPAEVAEEVPVVEESPKQKLINKAEEVRAGRDFGDIPLSDPYWEAKKAYDALP